MKFEFSITLNGLKYGKNRIISRKSAAHPKTAQEKTCPENLGPKNLVEEMLFLTAS